MNCEKRANRFDARVMQKPARPVDPNETAFGEMEHFQTGNPTRKAMKGIKPDFNS
jgi:hypothetical protein